MVSAAAMLGETAVSISTVEGMGDALLFEDSDFHGVIQDLTLSHEEVVSLLWEQGYRSVMESAIYSPNGVWGILTSHEDHAIVVGSRDFMSALAYALDLDAGVSEFLSYWKEIHQRLTIDISWVGQLLRHIYGDEKAARYLTAAEFPSQ